MNKECVFFIEIKAPEGLSGIEEHLKKCRLSLTPYLSGNNKVILREKFDESRFEWNMDSSENEIMVASGNFFIPVDESWRLLEDLAIILKSSGFPHEISIDDETGNKKHSCSFLWSR